MPSVRRRSGGPSPRAEERPRRRRGAISESLPLRGRPRRRRLLQRRGLKDFERSALFGKENVTMRDRSHPACFARVWTECAWLFRSLTENLEQCVFVLDRAGRCLAANDLLCRWLRRPHAEIVGRHLCEFWPYPLPRQQGNAHQRILRGEWIEVEEEGLDRQQPSRVRIRKAPLRDAEGIVCGVLCLFREVPLEPHDYPTTAQELPSFDRLFEKTILVVEPDRSVELLARTILSRWGFHVLSSEEGVQALAIYREKQGRVDLVVMEEDLPDQSGWELANGLLSLNPRLAIVLVNAASAPPPSWPTAPLRLSFLSKPYSPEQLVQCVGTALSTQG
jgi:CheY-like chemotaxis protein/PAS domain-containing protein